MHDGMNGTAYGDQAPGKIIGGSAAVTGYPVTTPDNHLVVNVGGMNAIVDTGSPVSFSRTGCRLETESGQIHELTPRAPIDLARLSELVGARIDALVGNDILLTTGFRLVWGTAPVFRLGEQTGDAVRARVSGECSIRFEVAQGVPLVGASVLPAGDRFAAVLDTGAAISLAPREWLRTHVGSPFAVRREWYPAIGRLVEFQTPLYRVVIEIGGMPRLQIFGEAPEQLAAGLESITGTPFLLGMDTLNAPGIREVLWNSNVREISLCG